MKKGMLLAAALTLSFVLAPRSDAKVKKTVAKRTRSIKASAKSRVRPSKKTRGSARERFKSLGSKLKKFGKKVKEHGRYYADQVRNSFRNLSKEDAKDLFSFGLRRGQRRGSKRTGSTARRRSSSRIKK